MISKQDLEIISSFQTGPGIPPGWFSGDDLTSGMRARGLPIGNLTSQLWGNEYLNEFDHWVTEGERLGAYLRYTDDFLLFGNDKAELWRVRSAMDAKLAALRLKLAEPKSRILQTEEGVPFLGFRFEREGRPRILGETKRRFERRRRSLWRRREFVELGRSLFAWYQFSKEANSHGLRTAYARLDAH